MVYQCASPEISILPPQKGLEFPGGGFCKTKKFKEMYETYWNFQRGGGFKKIPSVGEVWIFSGTTQYCKIPHFVFRRA